MFDRIETTPSLAIRQALDCVIKCEKDDKIDVDFSYTFLPYDLTTAFPVMPKAGFKGCIAVKLLGHDQNKPLNYDKWDGQTCDFLFGLENFSLGMVDAGLHRFRIYKHRLHPCRAIPKYHQNRKGFHRALRRLARDLENRNL